jgi:uncharacterized protein YybS (DUF2232 family)
LRHPSARNDIGHQESQNDRPIAICRLRRLTSVHPDEGSQKPFVGRVNMLHTDHHEHENTYRRQGWPLKEGWDGLLNRDFVLGTAITTFSFLSVVLIPLIGAVGIVFMPLPFLFYFTKFGRSGGGILFGVSLMLALLILKFFNPDIIFPLLLFIFVGATGMMLSEVLRRSWSIEKTLMVPVAVLLTCSGCFLLLHAYQAGQTPWQLIENHILSSVQENIKIYDQLDIPAEQITLIKDHAGPIAALLTRIFPAMFLVGASLIIWLNILAARRLYQKHGLHYPEFGDLTCWKAPERIVWLLIAAGGMLLIPFSAVTYSGWNLLIICLFVYICAGLSIIGYFFKVKRVPIFFKVLFYFLILIQQYLLLFVVVLGLFDLWADFRKLIKPAQDSNA